MPIARVNTLLQYFLQSNQSQNNNQKHHHSAEIVEETLAGGFTKVKGDQAQDNHANKISNQGQRDDGNKKDYVFGKCSFAEININKAQRRHGDQ